MFGKTYTTGVLIDYQNAFKPVIGNIVANGIANTRYIYVDGETA